MAESEKATSRRSRFPRFQFSIRTLLILITLVALGLGFGVQAWQRRRDLETIRHEMQGCVSYTFQVDPETGDFLDDGVPPGPQWLREYVGEPRYEDLFCDVYGIGVGFYATSITDEHLEAFGKILPRFTQLQALGIATSSKVTDAGLTHLQGVSQLRILNLEESQVTSFGLQYVATSVDMERLWLRSTRVDDNLACLASFRKLERLDLGETAVSDEGLRHLAGLDRLDLLMLDSTEVTDDGLKHLAGLKSLRLLCLQDTAITDEALEHLKDLPALRSLGLAKTQVGRSGSPNCLGCQRLDFLNLAETFVTDEFVAQLADSESLTCLILSETQVADACLETLATLPALDYLDLDGTNVTDAGLKHLAEAKRLRTLSLKQTKVTDAGVEKLQQALPDCRIER